MVRKPRNRRKPRGVSNTRRTTQAANESGKANRAIRARLVELESRMVLLERFLWDSDKIDSEDVELSMKHWEGHISRVPPELDGLPTEEE